MKKFTFTLPWIVGVILSVIISIAFPAQKVSAVGVKALSFDLPSFLGLPLEQALMFLVSSAVLGVLVAYLLGQFGVQPEQAQQIAALVVAIATAALAAGLKFVPPDMLGLTVWQTLVAVFGFFSSLAGVRAGTLAHTAQVRSAGLKSHD